MEKTGVVDRARRRTDLVVVVADGAGGTGDGAAAADMTCSMVVAAFRRGTMSTDAWIAELSGYRPQPFRCEGAAARLRLVMAVETLTETRSAVASVGRLRGAGPLDSLGFVDLTSARGEAEAPLLGTGEAAPKKGLEA